LLLKGLKKAKREGKLNHKRTTIPLGKLRDNNSITRLLTNLSIDNATRWNSTYFMIEATLQLRSALTYVFRNTVNREFKRLFFKDSDWLALNKLSKLFKVFLKPSKELQGQTYVTNSFTLLYIYQIYSKLTELARVHSLRSKDVSYIKLLTLVN